jgi:hypothetical protein
MSHITAIRQLARSAIKYARAGDVETAAALKRLICTFSLPKVAEALSSSNDEQPLASPTYDALAMGKSVPPTVDPRTGSVRPHKPENKPFLYAYGDAAPPPQDPSPNAAAMSVAQSQGARAAVNNMLVRSASHTVSDLAPLGMQVWAYNRDGRFSEAPLLEGGMTAAADGTRVMAPRVLKQVDQLSQKHTPIINSWIGKAKQFTGNTGSKAMQMVKGQLPRIYPLAEKAISGINMAARNPAVRAVSKAAPGVGYLLLADQIASDRIYRFADLMNQVSADSHPTFYEQKKLTKSTLKNNTDERIQDAMKDKLSKIRREEREYQKSLPLPSPSDGWAY